MFWNILDIIFNFFDLFPNGKESEEAKNHFKNLK